MISKLELFLYKTQSVLGYDYDMAGAASLAGSDLLECLHGSKIDSEPVVEAVVNVAGSLDQDPAIPGQEPSKGTINMKMIPGVNSGASLPDWARVLCGSCGFAAETVTGTGASSFTITPISAFTTAGMIWHYTGNVSANSALLQKHYNLVGDWKIKLEANKAPEISFTLDGAFHSQTDSTQPSATKSRVSAQALKAATISIVNSSTYQLISAEISGNQAPQSTEDPSEENGMGVSRVTDRKIKFSAKVYAQKAATNDQKTALRNSTEGQIAFGWGTGDKIMTIGGSYSQLTKCVRGEQNGISTWDIEGQWNRNDFAITINAE
jgi:hypothetical protein